MENNEQTVEVETTETEKVETNETQAERTFTQDEVNSLIAKEKARAKKNAVSKEELEEFNKWKDSQKTESEKMVEREKEYQKNLDEKEYLKKENMLLRKGVKEQDLDYIIYKVSKMDGDFEENITSFIENNPRFTEQEKGLKATGVQSQSISAEKESGVNAILRQKHPELFN